MPLKTRKSERGTKRGKTPLEALIVRCGLIKSWIASHLNVKPASFEYLLEEGFSEEQARALEELLHRKGEELLNFKLSNRLDGITQAKERFGIKKVWLASQLNMSEATLTSATTRDNGLRSEEIETLESALQSTAREFQSFKLSSSQIRKAA